jgi:hypothetical protein
MVALRRKPLMRWVFQLKGRGLAFTSIGSTLGVTSISDIWYVSYIERVKHVSRVWWWCISKKTMYLQICIRPVAMHLRTQQLHLQYHKLIMVVTYQWEWLLKRTQLPTPWRLVWLSFGLGYSRIFTSRTSSSASHMKMTHAFPLHYRASQKQTLSFFNIKTGWWRCSMTRKIWIAAVLSTVGPSKTSYSMTFRVSG